MKPHIQNAIRLLKHYGPGPHSSGSSQDVHGGGGGGSGDQMPGPDSNDPLDRLDRKVEAGAQWASKAQDMKRPVPDWVIAEGLETGMSRGFVSEITGAGPQRVYRIEQTLSPTYLREARYGVSVPKLPTTRSARDVNEELENRKAEQGYERYIEGMQP